MRSKLRIARDNEVDRVKISNLFSEFGYLLQQFVPLLKQQELANSQVYLSPRMLEL